MTKLQLVSKEQPRTPLENALDALKQIEAEDAEIGAAVARLEGVAAENSVLDAELAAIAAREAEDALAWARDPKGAAPGLRSADRAKIDAKATEARAKMAAAQKALEALHGQRNALAGRRKAAVAQIEGAGAEWLAGEASAAIGELEAAAVKLMALRARVEGIRSAAIVVAHSREDTATRGAFLALADTVAQRAPNKPMRAAEPLEVAPEAEAWRKALAERTGGLIGEVA